jgi:hypothetical protein
VLGIHTRTIETGVMSILALRLWADEDHVGRVMGLLLTTVKLKHTPAIIVIMTKPSPAAIILLGYIR